MNTITKSMKIAAILMICGLGSLIHAMEMMEVDTVTLAVEVVTLESNDRAQFTVDRSIAEQSLTLKNMLADMDTGLGLPIPLPNIDGASLRTILGILKEVKNIAPRKIDGQQSFHKIQSVVDSFLGGAAGGGAGGASFDEIKNIVLAANYLEIPFLINAAAHSLVRRAPEQIQHIVKTKDFDTFAAELHSYFQKYLALNSNGVNEEYSIADLIEKRPEEIKLDARGKLDLSGEAITDLYGLEYINPEIKSKILVLDLSKNQLTSIPANAFLGLNNLQKLDLDVNELTGIPANAFQGLNTLTELNLSYNELESIQANAFQGLNSLKLLDLSFTQLTSIPTNAFRGTTVTIHF